MKRYVPPMQLVDINVQEEDRDRVIIQLWMSKYHKLFKILFHRYVNTVRSNVDQNFEFKD